MGHVGYVSLFPMMLGLIPASSEKLEKALDIIRDPTQLWSGFGIRSLSKQDAYFRKGEDYWRGSIWININYLLLQSLHVIISIEYFNENRIILKHLDLIRKGVRLFIKSYGQILYQMYSRVGLRQVLYGNNIAKMTVKAKDLIHSRAGLL